MHQPCALREETNFSYWYNFSLYVLKTQIVRPRAKPQALLRGNDLLACASDVRPEKRERISLLPAIQMCTVRRRITIHWHMLKKFALSREEVHPIGGPQKLTL